MSANLRSFVRLCTVRVYGEGRRKEYRRATGDAVRFSKFFQGSSLAAHILRDRGRACRARRTNVPDNLAVDGARDAVLQLEVHLGNRVLGEHGSIRDITCCARGSANVQLCAGMEIGSAEEAFDSSDRTGRTNSSRLNHVADGESLDGLVLGGASRAVGAPDGLDVAAA